MRSCFLSAFHPMATLAILCSPEEIAMEKMAAVQTLIVFVGYCGILRAGKRAAMHMQACR